MDGENSGFGVLRMGRPTMQSMPHMADRETAVARDAYRSAHQLMMANHKRKLGLLPSSLLPTPYHLLTSSHAQVSAIRLRRYEAKTLHHVAI